MNLPVMGAGQWLSFAFLLVACCSLCGCYQLAADPSNEPQYIEFLQDFNETYDCSCRNSQLLSEYDFTCEITKTKRKFQTPFIDMSNSSISCSALPTKVIAHLDINCSGCYECVSVNLLEMTRAHPAGKPGIMVYPPSEITLHDCQINRMSVGMQQLKNEGVRVSYGMEVAQFGVPQSPGVGGYYTVNVTYPPGFNESDCWLNYLHIRKTNLWFLPAYVMHKCQHIRSIDIYNTPVTWVSMHDLLSIRSMDSLTMQNCSVITFAADAIQVALAAMDEFLQRPQPAVPRNPRVEKAIVLLKRMREDSGRLNLITNLYDIMDTANISFSLLFGYRSGQQGDPTHESDIPYGIGLSYLNLAHNKLTEIPYAISMFGNLAKIDLSNNLITSLYRNWLCWYPPIPDSEKATSNRHCYWFRGSRQTLKVLDLSYNRINQIGEIQPWHGVALAELYLQHNYITTINADAFTYSLLSKSLLTLQLDHNRLPYFHLQNLSRLESLSIQHGELTNIEPISIPRSSRLRFINLTNNKIGSIAPYAFRGLFSLSAIDLRNNSLAHIFDDSFKMDERPTLSSRVLLYISGQNSVTVCDCNHVYSKILIEESGMQRDNFTYPKILHEELNITECEFFSISNKTKQKRLMNETTEYDEFLCEFSGANRHQIPPRYCESSKPLVGDSGNKTNTCWETCVPQCTCYHTQDWSKCDISCSRASFNGVKFVVTIPAKYIDLSGIQDSDFFHRISEFTLKWETVEISNELLVLYLNNSNVRYVEANAFSSRNSLMQLYLHDNNLETLLASAVCSINSNLSTLTLTNNKLKWIDPEILSQSCLPKINEITLSKNPWKCNCEKTWLDLHDTLIRVSKTTQVVEDFQSMLCDVNPIIIEACETNKNDPQWQDNCRDILKSNRSGDYFVSDDKRLIGVCRLIEDTVVQQRKLIILSIFAGVLALLLTGLISLAIRRRHRLLAVVRVLVLLKYQRDSRVKQQVSRDSIPYDAMLWAADRDQDCLVDVLNCVRSASGGEQLELCVPESFLYSDLCSCPLTYFDCPAEGAKFSGKVVVALSERFLDTQYLALLQVIRELNSVSRNPFRDIVFLRLSSHRVSLQRQRQLGPEDVEAFATLRRILAGSDIVYKSVDWEYRLIERIRSRDNSSTFVTASQEIVDPATGIEGPALRDQVSRELADVNGEDQPLVLDIDRHIDFMRSRINSTICDWPPFHSESVPEVFVLAATEPTSNVMAATRTALDNIVSRLSGVRLGTNDARLVADWPDHFEAATPADRINAFLMKRTRQFVLLLSNSLLSWLRDQAGLQVEFQAFLAANSFRRRLLVILVGQVDNRSRIRYQALANQRLDDGETAEAAHNCFDMATDGDVEAFGHWLDVVLFRRPE